MLFSEIKCQKCQRECGIGECSYCGVCEMILCNDCTCDHDEDRKDASITLVQKLEWKDTTFTPANNQGETEAFQAVEAVGTGLGYIIYEPGDDEPDGFPWFSVSHMPSGSRLHRSPILHEQQAKRLVAALLPLLNWNRPTNELVADPEYKNAIMQVGKIYDQVDETFWEDLEEIRELECWPEGITSASA